MGMVNFNIKIGTYMSGTNPMAAIGSKGWWQMLQRYKLFTCEVVSAFQAWDVYAQTQSYLWSSYELQAKIGTYILGTKPMALMVVENLGYRTF